MSVPDVYGELVGFRAWKVNRIYPDNPRLGPMFHTGE